MALGQRRLPDNALVRSEFHRKIFLVGYTQAVRSAELRPVRCARGEDKNHAQQMTNRHYGAFYRETPQILALTISPQRKRRFTPRSVGSEWPTPLQSWLGWTG